MRRYQYVQGYRQKYKIIALRQAFHGRSMACISMSDSPAVREGCSSAGKFNFIPINDSSQLLKAFEVAHIAGVIFEPIQGEGE